MRKTLFSKKEQDFLYFLQREKFLCKNVINNISIAENNKHNLIVIEFNM